VRQGNTTNVALLSANDGEGAMNDEREAGCCARCGGWFGKGELRTRLYVAEDPAGDLGLSGVFHDRCAVPVWAYVAPEAVTTVRH
jgi:hypothetical protein